MTLVDRTGHRPLRYDDAKRRIQVTAPGIETENSYNYLVKKEV